MSVRYDWYQSDDAIILSFYIKKANKETVPIEFGTQHVTGKYTEGAFPHLDLANEIVPDASTVEYLSTKIEVRCSKAQKGLQWKTLERDAPREEAGRPVYPTSSKKNTDWTSFKAPEEAKAEGDEALNALFKQIYSDGNDETRKAMIKSFTESGGTCLSTNWSDVGKGKVEIKPPEGMEAKSWTKP